MNLKKPMPKKLNRDRAVRLSAIEGMRLSTDMKLKFESFDRQGTKSADRRKAIVAHFKAQ